MEIIDASRPAEAFPVGEYLRDELDARGLTGAEFAEILGRPPQVVSQILNNHKEITPETATEIAAATDTTPETWLGLQDTYRLWKLRREPLADRLSEVARRARLRRIAPLTELRKRGFAPEGDDIDAQEDAVCALLGISSPEETPTFAVAARRVEEAEALSPAQLSWVGCVRAVARDRPVEPFAPDGLAALGRHLTRTVITPAALSTLPALLAEVGVRLVHVDSFRGGKMDGVAFCDDRGPVIGISGRGGRFDGVLFTVLHEIAHVHLGHVTSGYTIDVDLGTAADTEQERDADSVAADWAIPGRFATTGRISKAAVEAEAARLGVHPAVLVGKLQHAGVIPWSHFNAAVPRVKNVLARWND
ncbi:HigA family addiction module antitoxin [Saccharopolyspora gloriosae]|uniref:HTH-type transcriptional regulator/antitoxin HigA n=1 Tax=Saccharopolyspora gloriosae TaxID=455344 RepID=A0A840NLC1_9PSEU|nr:HigA family addiction module antitoxin [Saccharopolyspora gloriosae]MBB5072650.1 HTH-type transcriptional regulator/antitoxin HigA [Saccharopolyspora gloriosae]